MLISNVVNLSLALVLTAKSGQAEDWGVLFEQLTSKDEQTSAAARKKSFDEVVPFMLEGEAARVIPEINQIAQYLAAPAPIRLQASGLIASIAYARPDSAQVLAGVLPKVTRLLQDEAPRIRFNTASTLSHLKPGIPAEVIPSLLASLKSGDRDLMRGAIGGAMRASDRSPEAAQAVVAMLLSNSDREMQIAILNGIRPLRITSKGVQNGLAELLETTKDSELLITGVSAASAIGSAAIDRLVNSVKMAAANSKDAKVAAAAERALPAFQKSQE